MEHAAIILAITLVALLAASVLASRRTQRKHTASAACSLAALALAAGLAGFTATPAFAAEGAFDSTPDNELAATLGDDALWAGQDKTFSKVEAPNDILAAGQNITVKNSTVGGSIRAAGETIAVNGTNVAHSITLACNTASVSDSTAQAVALAASSASFSGECDSLYIFAQDAVIDGTVHGDVVVNANTIQLGPNATIEGSIRGTAGSDPNIADGATYGSLNLTHGESNDNSESTGFDFGGLLAAIIFGALSTLVIAVVVEWLARKHTAKAATLAKERMGYVAASGIIGALVAPIAIIILCCLIITLPIAGALALALIALTLIAEGYAAAVLGKLAFKNMKRIPAACTMGAIVGVIGALPFVGTVVAIASFAFALGCVLQSVFLGTKDRGNSENAAIPPAPQTPGNPPQPPIA